MLFHFLRILHRRIAEHDLLKSGHVFETRRYRISLSNTLRYVRIQRMSKVIKGYIKYHINIVYFLIMSLFRIPREFRIDFRKLL